MSEKGVAFNQFGGLDSHTKEFGLRREENPPKVIN